MNKSQRDDVDVLSWFIQRRESLRQRDALRKKNQELDRCTIWTCCMYGVGNRCGSYVWFGSWRGL